MRKQSGISIDEQKITVKKRIDSIDEASKIRSEIKEYYDDTLAHLQARRTGKVFVDRFMDRLEALEPAANEYMLVNINILLWLYKLGCDTPEKKYSLYTVLASEVLKIRNWKESGSGTALKLDNMPLTEAGKRLIRAHARDFKYKKNQGFNQLQMLITALSYVVMGRWQDTESMLIHPVLTKAAPILKLGLRLKEDEEYLSYTCCYNENHDSFSAGLFCAAEARTACILIGLLVSRIKEFDRSGTRIVDRDLMMTKLLTYLQTSRENSPEGAKMKSFTYSSTYVW